MASTPAQKFKIKPGFRLRQIGAPDNFLAELQPLPPDVSIIQDGAADQVHWFVKDRQQLEVQLNDVLQLVTGATLCWVYYPKGSSKIQTDLTRDRGWDALLAHTEFQWISLVSFNDTWSAFGFRLNSPSDVVRKGNPGRREIFDFVNPATKEVVLPADLEQVMRGTAEWDVFHKLAFSHKKEYIEWIITARREETRRKRIEVTLEKLAAGWKNPRNI